MSINLVGVLPVSGINIGLALAIPAIQAKITSLQEILAQLAASIGLQAQLTINFPPDLPSLSVTLGLYAQALVDLLDPTKIVTFSFDLQADFLLQLGLINAALALVGEISATLQLGLDAGGITAWSYSGPSAGFGTTLAQQTVNGWPNHAPSDDVGAVILATEDFTSWGALGSNFNLFGSDAVEATSAANLKFQGTFSGFQLNTGVLDVSIPINLFLLELQGLKAGLEASLNACLGINLPDISVLLDILGSIDLNFAISNLVNVQVDLALQIQLFNIELQFFLDLLAQLKIDAGGLAVWSYSGSASGLGSSLSSEIAGGIPGGKGPNADSYGLVLACKVPAAWAAFGLIFLT